MTTASFYKEVGCKMRWYRNLYLGPNAAQNIEKIRRKAASGKVMAGVYYITPASTKGNLLDIFHNGMLCQKLFAGAQRLDVVGVAEGKQEALRLTEQMILDIYCKTGGFDIEDFFKEEDFLDD